MVVYSEVNISAVCKIQYHHSIIAHLQSGRQPLRFYWGKFHMGRTWHLFGYFQGVSQDPNIVILDLGTYLTANYGDSRVVFTRESP